MLLLDRIYWRKGRFSIDEGRGPMNFGIAWGDKDFHLFLYLFAYGHRYVWCWKTRQAPAGSDLAAASPPGRRPDPPSGPPAAPHR